MTIWRWIGPSLITRRERAIILYDCNMLSTGVDTAAPAQCYSQKSFSPNFYRHQCKCKMGDRSVFLYLRTWSYSVHCCCTVCWNSVYRRLFHYNRWQSVKCCIKGLGHLDLVHILALQKLKFWYKVRHSSNRTVCNMSMFCLWERSTNVACKLHMFCHR